MKNHSHSQSKITAEIHPIDSMQAGEKKKSRKPLLTEKQIKSRLADTGPFFFFHRELLSFFDEPNIPFSLDQ